MTSIIALPKSDIVSDADLARAALAVARDREAGVRVDPARTSMSARHLSLLRYFRLPVLGGSSRRGEVVMAHTIDAEVRPTRKLFWRAPRMRIMLSVM